MTNPTTGARARTIASRLAERARTFELPRWASVGFSLAKGLSESLPDRNASAAQTVLRTVASVDVVRNILWPARGNPIAIYAERHGLEARTSEQFVRLFFATDLHKKFAIGRIRITEYQTIVEARDAKLGHFAFVQSDYGEDPDASFYVARGVDMANVLADLWAAYDGRIHVNVVAGPYGSGTRSEFATFALPSDALYGEASGRLAAAVAHHRRCAAAGVPRSYMLYGPPGTGKSCFAAALADRLGDSILKLDASSLAHATVRDMAFLLDNLRPDFVIVDDVDKADVARAIPTLLDVLERFKTDGRGATMVMTANAIGGFDPGMLRPGRITTWIEFALPDASERRVVLASYAREVSVDLTPGFVNTLAEATEGLSQDYLREIVSQFPYAEHVDDVLRGVELMKRLLGETKKPPSPGYPSHADVLAKAKEMASR